MIPAGTAWAAKCRWQAGAETSHRQNGSGSEHDRCSERELVVPEDAKVNNVSNNLSNTNNNVANLSGNVTNMNNTATTS